MPEMILDVVSVSHYNTKLSPTCGQPTWSGVHSSTAIRTRRSATTACWNGERGK